MPVGSSVVRHGGSKLVDDAELPIPCRVLVAAYLHFDVVADVPRYHLRLGLAGNTEHSLLERRVFNKFHIAACVGILVAVVVSVASCPEVGRVRQGYLWGNNVAYCLYFIAEEFLVRNPEAI